jgi:hypothetical protein
VFLPRGAAAGRGALSPLLGVHAEVAGFQIAVAGGQVQTPVERRAVVANGCGLDSAEDEEQDRSRNPEAASPCLEGVRVDPPGGGVREGTAARMWCLNQSGNGGRCG